jgi:hypothetical protein
MTTNEKIGFLLNRNFLLMANWQGQDRQLTEIDASAQVTLQGAGGQTWQVPLQEVNDIGFASQLVPDRYLPIDDFDMNLTTRFGIFCQLTDLNDASATALLGRPVQLDQLRDPNDWKVICAGLIGL